MSVTLNERIRTLRESLKLTQADLAHELGVSRLTYIAIESGEKKPTIEQIEKISSILKTTSKEILFPSLDTELNSKISMDNGEKYRQMCAACIKFGGSEKDGKITKTKLAKLLYLVDFSWYRAHGASMSGLFYRALPRGPVAEEFFRITDEMFESGTIQIEPKGAALMFSVVEDVAVGSLTTAELSHIRNIAEKWRSSDTQAIVDFTHAQMPWTLTEPGSVIPYELVLKIPGDQMI